MRTSSRCRNPLSLKSNLNSYSSEDLHLESHFHFLLQTAVKNSQETSDECPLKYVARIVIAFKSAEKAVGDNARQSNVFEKRNIVHKQFLRLIMFLRAV